MKKRQSGVSFKKNGGPNPQEAPAAHASCHKPRPLGDDLQHIDTLDDLGDLTQLSPQHIHNTPSQHFKAGVNTALSERQYSTLVTHGVFTQDARAPCVTVVDYGQRHLVPRSPVRRSTFHATCPCVTNPCVPKQKGKDYLLECKEPHNKRVSVNKCVEFINEFADNDLCRDPVCEFDFPVFVKVLPVREAPPVEKPPCCCPRGEKHVCACRHPCDRMKVQMALALLPRDGVYRCDVTRVARDYGQQAKGKLFGSTLPTRLTFGPGG